MNWDRFSFFGGCNYIRDDGVVVTGYYSPNPIQFESDCKRWTASNCEGEIFESAGDAIDAANHKK